MLRPQLNDPAEASILIASTHPFLEVHQKELLESPPYQINPYMPMTYRVYGMLERAKDLSVTRARLINFLFLFASLLIVFKAFKKLGSQPLEALAGVLFFFSWGATRMLGIQLRPDILALPFLCLHLFFMIEAIHFFERGLQEKAKVRFCFSAFFLLVACSFKIMVWTLPLFTVAVSFHFFKRFAALVWAVTALVFAACLFFLNVHSDGGFWRHVIAVQGNLHQFVWLFRERQLLFSSGGTLFSTASLSVFLLLAANALQFKKLVFFQKLISLWMPVSALVASLLMRKWGAGNYYLDYGLSCAFLFVTVLQRLEFGFKKWVLPVLAAQAFALNLMTSDFPDFVKSPEVPASVSEVMALLENLGRSADLWEEPGGRRELESLLLGKNVLTDYDSVLLAHNMGAHVFINDPGCFNVQFVAGNFSAQDADRFRESIQKKLDLVLLSQPIEWWYSEQWLNEFKGNNKNQGSVYFFEKEIREKFSQLKLFSMQQPHSKRLAFVYQSFK